VTESVPEAEAFIRFRLGELSSRNEHHRFEEIATRIAQKRVSSNILIATGPVSAGGDQGRDAESFTTRLPDELPHSAGFAAAAATAPVVVACTVQSSSLKRKVLDDLVGICAEGADPVDHVAFFSVHPISAGVTHELKRTARNTYGVTLDIFCGDSIAMFLAEPDLVWVARHYLELPEQLVPRPEAESAPQWYADLLDGLRRNNGPVALTPAVQGEITRGLRHATWDEDANADLPEWLDFMGAFLADSEDGADTELVFRACYEMGVARLRGMGVAAGIEDLIRRAIDFACTSSQPNVLDDAVVLASYWGSAWKTGVARANSSEIVAAMAQLRARLVELLDSTDPTTYPLRAATLTGALATVHLTPDWEKAETILGRPEQVEVDPLAGERLDESAVDVSGLEELDLIDFEAALRYLLALVDLLPPARVYPFSQLARVFALFAPIACEYPGYEQVRDGLDAALAQVRGDSATAVRCRDRGMALVRAGKPLQALAELHNAKAKWFHGDALYGAILTTRYLGLLYARLGLTYAAKMYACAAVVLSDQGDDRSVKEHIPHALLEAADYAQQTGTWVDAAALTELALLARVSMLTDPFDCDKHPELDVHNTNATLELAAIRQFWPEIEPLIEAAHSTTDWYDGLVEVIEEAGGELDLTEEEFQTEAAMQLDGPILGDVGPTRRIDFRALGIRWVFEFANDRATVLAAEGLVAALQVVLADVARMNPVLTDATVCVTVDTEQGEGEQPDRIDIDDSGPEIMARAVVSTAPGDLQAHHRSVIVTCLQLLHAVHVRPMDDLLPVTESLMRGGLQHKTSIGRPYAEAAGLLNEDHYRRCAAAIRPPSSSTFRPVGREALGPSTATGVGYDRDEALLAIRGRYQSANSVLRYTLPRLLADEGGRATIARLRESGWLDWQVLAALQNAVLNWRIEQAGIQFGVDDPDRIQQLARQPETAESPEVPLQVFAGNDVDMYMTLQMVAVARSWRLRVRPEALGRGELRDLLTRRYQYAVDDVPHRDLLNCLEEDGEPALLDVRAGHDGAGCS
jgi:hypothetical protein